MVTSFARFLIAFSFLRSGLGLQTTPNNLILVSLALFMTLFVMAPTFQSAWNDGVKPMVENKISQEDGYTRTTAPFRVFMRANVREKDLAVFEAMSAERFGEQDKAGPDDLRVLVPAFMVSELRRGFEIGFLVTLPFLVIDLVVATIMTVDGHDDDAADGGVATTQGLVLRSRRWLEPARRSARQVFRLETSPPPPRSGSSAIRLSFTEASQK